jgi:hypothetical protein
MDSEKKKMNGWDRAVVVFAVIFALWALPFIIVWGFAKAGWERLVEFWRG